MQVFQSPGFSGSRIFLVQVFRGPGPGSESGIRVQILEVAVFEDRKVKTKVKYLEKEEILK